MCRQTPNLYFPQEEISMANHLTPAELAREAGLGLEEVLSKCLELRVPIFRGRIDKSLFLASLRQGASSQQPASAGS
jgi:hypothetical protein